MGFFTSTTNFPWIDLKSLDQFNEYFQGEKSFFVFKHSTRCSISSMALRRFEKEYSSSDNVVPLFLDLLKHRELSNEIERITGIIHQSPQLIFIDKKKVLYHASHEQIDGLSIQKFN